MAVVSESKEDLKKEVQALREELADLRHDLTEMGVVLSPADLASVEEGITEYRAGKGETWADILRARQE